jgi:hypothetical protein
VVKGIDEVGRDQAVEEAVERDGRCRYHCSALAGQAGAVLT